MVKLDTNRIIGFYATQNYGKTYGMSKIVQEYAKRMNTFIFDTNFERLTAYPQNIKNISFIKAKNPTMQENPKFLNDSLLYIRSNYESPYLIVIEDLDKMITVNIRTEENKEIYKLASDSRHQRIAMMYATKEPVNIPVKLRSNTNLFFFGSFQEPNHVKTISNFIDKKQLKAIKKPEFIMLDRYTNTTEKITF